MTEVPFGKAEFLTDGLICPVKRTDMRTLKLAVPMRNAAQKKRAARAFVDEVGGDMACGSYRTPVIDSAREQPVSPRALWITVHLVW